MFFNPGYHKVKELVAEQQKGQEGKPEFTVGIQLLDIAANEPESAELLARDLQIDGMKLSDAAKVLKAHADKNHGSARCYCITPLVAEELLRKFYGLPERVFEDVKPVPQNDFIDITDFI